MLTPPAPSAKSIRERFGLSHTVARWLAERGHSDPALTARFLEPRLAHLSSPEKMADRDVVSARLASAIRRRERIVVFGDYDCDGITSAAIMTEVIRALGGSVVPLLASRFDGGYGLSAAAVRRVLEAGAQLLVTCDCGSSDHDGLAELAQAGVQAVVIDHHLVPERPLPAIGFLNPHRRECGFAYKGLASCGLALSIAAGVRKALGVDLDLRYWLDLVAIGTVADVAPLDGDNRCLVRAGIDAIRAARRPGMAALLEIAKLSRDSPLTGRDIAFRLAPHINAPGRLGSAQLALRLLLAPDLPSAREISLELDQISAQRRSLSDETLREAAAEIEASGQEHQAAIVVGKPGWNAGIVGIVAGRLVERYGRPVIVVGFDGEVGRGSVRGPLGVRLYDALVEAKDVLVRYGGHQQAAGLEVQLAKLDELRERFIAAIRQRGPAPVVAASDLLALDPADEPRAVLADLDRLEPCGFGNPRPRIVVDGQVLGARELKNGHLKLTLDLGENRRLSCFAVSRGALARDLGGVVRVTGDLRHNDFPGGDPVEMFVEELSFEESARSGTTLAAAARSEAGDIPSAPAAEARAW